MRIYNIFFKYSLNYYNLKQKEKKKFIIIYWTFIDDIF